MTAKQHKWQFMARFGKQAFGREPQLAVKCVREAVEEIEQVSTQQPELAAEGAVLFLELVSPAIDLVDNSSGELGAAVDAAIEALVTIISDVQLDQAARLKYYERLNGAYNVDEVRYLKSLRDHWGAILFQDRKPAKKSSKPVDPYLAQFQAMAKQHPDRQLEQILNELIATTPGEEGIWFETAVEARLFQQAASLANKYPCDPSILNRAVCDYIGSNPSFAMCTGMASISWMLDGQKYDYTDENVLTAFFLTMGAAKMVGGTEDFLHGLRLGLKMRDGSDNLASEIIRSQLETYGK